MFWVRSKVLWTGAPRLYGKQQKGSKPVDFGGQIGVYLLHDAQGVVYVGKTTDQSLGKRLYDHTVDRLNGRWTRFSWFGIYPVQEDGTLNTRSETAPAANVIISTMEAVLIEGLEPRQNKRAGEGLKDVEFIQWEDPQLQREQQLTLLAEITSRLRAASA